ncbi:citrate synthase [Geobacter sp. OR-1]|uniref:citrate/2-methylcitrate synthase n=1 Tax=Geobacter sp. OR-1 TaxID=1266765 RepID=UPI000543FBF7|nr:citrate/2-methylcitrate synthase [Geobacter sp. OR-1]GAM09079.1 citrate synthase [Geobacter sp. OR-1]
MNGPEFLQQNVDCLKSSMGACFPGERAVFRGHDLHGELKDLDWMELYVFGITGRRFTPEQLRLMHAIWVLTSYPDARIWNNRVAALAGSARSTGTLGVAAALAVSEASIYGRGIDVKAIEFITVTRKALDNGVELADCVQAELKKHRGIAGFGRPLASGDERIAPIMALAHSLGLDEGPHVRLAFDVNEFLLSGRWRLGMNFGAIAAAFGADLGLSTREYYLFVFPAFLAGMPPCFIESAQRTEGALFPLSCEHILYEGEPKRSWQPEDRLLKSVSC